MFRDREEELQRLEEELLAAEEEPEEYEEELDEEEYEEYEEAEDEVVSAPVRGYKVYNSDRCDVNLEQFSKDVERGRRGGCLAGLFALLTAVFVLLLYLYLKQGGYV